MKHVTIKSVRPVSFFNSWDLWVVDSLFTPIAQSVFNTIGRNHFWCAKVVSILFYSVVLFLFFQTMLFLPDTDIFWIVSRYMMLVMIALGCAIFLFILFVAWKTRDRDRTLVYGDEGLFRHEREKRTMRQMIFVLTPLFTAVFISGSNVEPQPILALYYLFFSSIVFLWTALVSIAFMSCKAMVAK